MEAIEQMSEEYHEMRTIEINDDYETIILDVQFTLAGKIKLIIDFAGEKKAILVPTTVETIGSSSKNRRW